uniref:Uncharacterized protein n=1 Tax=Anguilla anguilla TaxID=7936 RepID=A0A0E9SJS5_ANGAN
MVQMNGLLLKLHKRVYCVLETPYKYRH